MNQPPLWSRSYVIIALINFMTFATFYYLLVSLPIYAMEQLQAHESEIGLLTVVFLLTAIVVRPLAGRWIERMGMRFVLILSLLVLCGASVAYFIPHSVGGLLIIRLLHGIGFGMATTVSGSIVADLIPDSRKGEGMGYYGLTMTIAMVIGPYLGLTMMQRAPAEALFALHAAATLLSLLAGLFIRLPGKSTPQPPMLPLLPEERAPLRRILERSALPIALVAAFFALIYSAIISYVPVYAKEVGLTEAASYFFIIYALVLLATRPFTGRWFDRYGANVIIYPGIICFAAGTLVLSQASSQLLFFLSAALIGLGWGTVFPSLMTIAIQVARPAKRALATATFHSTFDIGFGIGSFVISLLAAQFGFSRIYFYSIFFILAGLGVYYLLHGRGSERPSSSPSSIIPSNVVK